MSPLCSLEARVCDVIPLINMEEAGVLTYTAASPQVAFKTSWLHIWGVVIFYDHTVFPVVTFIVSTLKTQLNPFQTEMQYTFMSFLKLLLLFICIKLFVAGSVET